MLTIEQVTKALPPHLKTAATPALVNLINNITTDQDMAEQIRANFIGYSGVLKDGKYKTEDYVNAVTYVSYKLMGDTNQDAWFKTFPARYQRLVANGTSTKDIAAHVSAYNKGKLVNAITEQTIVPSWVLNQDIYQKAINTQFELMTDNTVSPKVRSDAANSLLTHLAKPKEVGPLVSIDMRESNGVDALKEALGAFALAQQQAIAGGAPIKSVLDQQIVDVTAKV